MAWSLPRINPVNKIMGKNITIDKISISKRKEDNKCNDCGILPANHYLPDSIGGFCDNCWEKNHSSNPADYVGGFYSDNKPIKGGILDVKSKKRK